MAPGGGGRAAEHVGRRTSSCVFADNIAKASIAAYNAVLASVPEPARSDAFGGGRQTVLAAVVARDERLDALRVVSLGAGTKFMSTVDIEADAEAGARVRDSHAEVLARRGLKRFLYAQLAAEAGRSHREPSPVATGRKRTREREEPGSFTAPATEPRKPFGTRRCVPNVVGARARRRAISRPSLRHLPPVHVLRALRQRDRQAVGQGREGAVRGRPQRLRDTAGVRRPRTPELERGEGGADRVPVQERPGRPRLSRRNRGARGSGPIKPTKPRKTSPRGIARSRPAAAATSRASFPPERPRRGGC